MLRLLAILVVAGGMFMALNVPNASAITITWGGNGAEGGTCDDIGEFDDLDPGPGQQGWLFILTSPEDDNWTLNATFSDGAQSVEGEQQGMNGSIHFIVYTDAGATLTSATATNGTALSVLTVSHCELGDEVEGQTLTVNKVCEGTDVGQFDLLVDGSIHGTGNNVGCGEGTGAVEVDPDTYTVSENIDEGGPFTTTFGGDCNTTTGVVTVEEGEDAECTVINTLVVEDGQTLTVNKVCEGTEEGQFDLLVDGSIHGSGEDVGCGEGTGAVEVDPDTYTVSENIDSGGPFTTTFGGDCNTATGVVTVEEGEDAACTVINTLDEEEDTTLTVVKDCGDFVGTGPTFIFLIDGLPIDGLTATCEAGSETVSIDPGVDFLLTEDLDLPDGWSFDSATCDGGGPEAIEGGVELNADEGDDITCTFFNDFEGEVEDTTLTVVKDCGDFVGTGPTFIFLIDGLPIDGLTATCEAGSETVSIDPGVDFLLTEDLDLPDGWSFDSATCDGGGPEAIEGGVELNADEGDDITCTFVNAFTTEAGVAEVASPTPTSTSTTPAGAAAAELTPTPTATTPAAVSEVQGAVATPEEEEVSAVSSDVAPTQVSEVGGVTQLPSTGSGGLLSDEGATPWYILASVAIFAALAGATLLLTRDRR